MLAEPLLAKVLGDDAEVLARYRGTRAGALGPTSARSSSSTLEARQLRRAGRLRHHRRRHRAGAPVPRLRRRRHGGVPRLRTAGRQRRSTRDGHFTADLALVGGMFFKDADEALVADLRARGPAVPARPVRAQLPALLALPHAADVLRAAVLVHPHHRDQGPAARRERGDQLVPGDDQERPLRRLAEQQHRLGAVPRPLLGHAAAGVAQRRRPVPHGVRRLAGRTGRAVRRRPSTTRTARSSTTSRSPARARRERTAGYRR